VLVTRLAGEPLTHFSPGLGEALAMQHCCGPA
jgi:hypothetical protein